MKKRITLLSAIFLCFFTAPFLIFGTSLSAEFKFKEFKSDREKFERYTSEAEKSVNEQQWQNILDSGKQEMLADWERSADSERERYIREGAADNEVRVSLEESRAAWENDYEKAESGAKGSWYIKREKLVFEDIDFSLLREIVENAGKDSNVTNVTNVAQWDSFVSSSLAGVNSAWDLKFLPPLSNLRSKGDILTGEEKAGFEAELAAFENDLRKKFEVERNTILYSGRNIFITELMVDTTSLRYQSDKESADAATDNLIKDVKSDLKTEEDKILNRSYNSEGQSPVDFSSMGDNWEEELKQLVNTGMEKWNATLDRLYQQMLNWKQSAEDAYNSAEAIWLKSAEKLGLARLEWEAKLSKEINESLDKWKSEESELTVNIERSREDFSSYMNNLSSQWDDHSSGLIDMAVNGSKVYAESLDNIKWLQEMALKCTNQGAFNSESDITPYLSPEILADISSVMEQYPWIGNNYKYRAKFNGSTLNSDGTILTENYTVDMLFSFPKSDYFPAGFEFTMKSYSWDNVVTDGSDAVRKSTYFYYKTELERWKKIETSFSGIAHDAELYMHEKNMLGQGGPGYLNNAGGSDPYLMTDAEFALEVSSRDRDFWQRRLDIARAVLDYAGATKREGAAATEANKVNAKTAMDSAKALYETTLNEVQDIVVRLNALQGKKPAEARNALNAAEWDAYLTSIEYLTQNFTEANQALKIADEDYTLRKRALIYLENGEDSSIIKKEIEGLERNILQSDRALYVKQVELYKTEMNNEFSRRSAGFAQNYETAVKNFEESKLRFNNLKNILTGDESDAALVSWGENIVSAKENIWEKEAAVYYGNIIQNLISGFNGAAGNDKILKGEQLSAFIRNIYFDLQGNVKSSEMIVSTLHDNNFDPDLFLKSSYSDDQAAYENYAETSVKALEIVDSAFELFKNDSSKQNYNSILDWLKTELAKEKYTYNAPNSSYMEHYTALKYFEENFHGLTPEAWESSRDRLDSDINFSEKAADLHRDFKKLNAVDLAELISENEAIASGRYDADAIALLREYYMTGSGIAGLKFIEEFDRSAELGRKSYENLKNYVSLNYNYLQKGQNLLTEYTYLNDMLGYINSKVSTLLLDISESNPLSVEAFKNLTPESLSEAAGALASYMDDLEQRNMPVPDFLRSAAETVAQLKVNLDSGLFILRYMNNDTSAEMAGTVDDIYARKLAEAGESSVVMEFIQGCEEIIETGKDDYASGMNILSLYEKLTETQKSYIAQHKDANVKEVSSFIENLYLYRYTINLNSLAAQYSGTELSVTPEQYVSTMQLRDEDKTKLIAAIKPVYERRNYDKDFADGKILNIEDYITSRDLDGDTEKSLRAYAMITEYNKIASTGNYTSTDPAFTTYMQSKDLKDLPDDAKIFAASKYYYDEMFSKNKVPADVEQFLEDKFGSAGVSGSLVDAVKKYAGMLSTVSFFYGNDLEKYTKDMDADAMKYFLMYINGDGDAILPGFEYGIYGSNIATAQVLVEQGKITAELDKYASGFSELVRRQGKNLDAANAGLKNASALQAFYKNGNSEKNWRDSLLPVIEKTEKTDTAPASEKNIITLQILDDLSGWFDTLDSVTGERSTLIYSKTPAPRDGKTFSINGIIDNMNKIVSVFTALGESMKPEFKPDSQGSIAGFLEKVDADSVYKLGENYAFENGAFTYETGLIGIVSGYKTSSDGYTATVAAIKGELNGIDSGMENNQSTLQSKKMSYDLMTGGKDKETLLKELEVSRRTHDLATQDVERLRTSLIAARGIYEAANTSYINKMNEVSTAYSSYKGLEFNYERAYSVWEYANTPYLKEDKTDAGDIVSGETPAGEAADYGTIPVPDARDNYARILAKFNEVNTQYIAKAAAVTNQDTVEKLNSDPEYIKMKADFERKSQSYIRTSQVNVEVSEDLEEYKQQYNISKQIYETSKDSVSFYSGKYTAATDAEKATLKKLRDTILNHMLKTGSEGESKAVMETYLSAITWYSSVTSTAGLEGAIQDAQKQLAGGNLNLGEIYGINNNISTWRDIIASNAPYVTAYNNLSEQIRDDVKNIYDSFKTNNDSLSNILSSFYAAIYWRGEYEYANHRYNSTPKIKVSTRRIWRDRRDSRWGKYANLQYQYDGAIAPIRTSLDNARKDKIDYAAKEAAYTGISSVRYIDEIKSYLKQGKYGLTDEDLKHLYDSTSTGYPIDGESINLDDLRNQNEKQRKDLDGETVYADVNDTTITVLDKDGKAQFDKDGKAIEVYNINDASIRVEKIDGKYVVYDRTYNIAAVAGILKTRAESIRQSYYTALLNYSSKPVEEGGHDSTVVLRDLETTYHGLQEFAETFNLNNAAVTTPADKEIRQRGLEGYGTITREYVNNGNETSLQGLIMNALISQSTRLQEQLWAQQSDKFQERKNRWSEVTGYIVNRGMKEWRENYGEFKNLWTKWRFDAKKMITEGEEFWTSVNNGMKTEMNSWTAETSKASSKEAAERIYGDLEGRISRYEADLKNKIPGNVKTDLNIDKILSQSMKSNPIDSLGILTQSMQNTDTTAGFTNMLNLGLNGSLFKYNEKQMEEYTNAMGLMKNLQVIDILNNIIDSFNKQLEESNKSVYDGIDFNIRGNPSFGDAPYQRKKAENRWDIRVCVASNLTGDKFKTRQFADYNSYINSTVYFQPIKGLGGTTIDFTEVNTYNKLDGEELDTYVGLESEWLSRKIEDVFKEGGTFSGHQEKEYNRLYAQFGETYGEWMAGEALQNAGFYAKPIGPGAPSIMTGTVMIAQVVGTCTGMVWIGAAANALALTVQIADGTAEAKHVGTQVAVGAASAMTKGASDIFTSGITYDQDGGVGWDKKQFKKGAKKNVVKLGLKMGGMDTFSTEAIVDGLKTDGGWNEFGFDTKNWRQHLLVGASAALSEGAGQASGSNLLGQFLSQSMQCMAYDTMGGKGFSEEYGKQYGKFNWDNFGASTSRLGGDLGGMAMKKLDLMATEREENRSKGFPEGKGLLDYADDMLGGIWQSLKGAKKSMGEITDGIIKAVGLTDVVNTVASGYNKAVEFMNGDGNIFGNIGKIIGGGVADGARSGWNGVTNFAQSVKNKVSYSEFGTNSNPLVEKAKLNYQFESAGLTNQNLEANYQPGAVIEADDGTIFQINLDEDGNRILFNTGENSKYYVQMAGLFSEGKPIDKFVDQTLDISSRYQAIHNYDDGKTEINGIKISFSNNDYNTKDKISKVSGRLWNNLTDAADDTDVNVTGIKVYSVDYGTSDPHAAGVGIDIIGLYVNGSKDMTDYRRDYKDGQFNPTTQNSVITNFENAFFSKDGSTHVWGPWQMKDNVNNWDFKNMVSDYPGVVNTGIAGTKASELLKDYADKYKVDQTKLFRSYQHTNHGHYQVDFKYSTVDKYKVYKLI